MRSTYESKSLSSSTMRCKNLFPDEILLRPLKKKTRVARIKHQVTYAQLEEIRLGPAFGCRFCCCRRTLNGVFLFLRNYTYCVVSYYIQQSFSFFSVSKLGKLIFRNSSRTKFKNRNLIFNTLSLFMRPL